MSATMINNSKGILWALVSMFFAGSMTVAVRAAGDHLPSTEIVLYRFTFVTIVLLFLGVTIPYFRSRLRFTQIGQHLVRGVLIAVATHTGFYAITVIPVNTAAVLFFTAPIFASVLGVIFHGETIGPRRMAAIGFGFLGALIVCEPWTAAQPGAITGYAAAFTASLCFALALTMSRGLAEADGVFATVDSAGVISTVLSLPFAFDGLVVPANWITTAIIVLFLSVAGLIRNVADVEQYHYGEAAIVGPFSYLRLIVVATGAYLYFNELPSVATLAGGAIIIASTLYIAIRERRLKKSTRPSVP